MKKVLEKEYKLQFIFPFIDVYSIKDSNKKIILINSNKITKVVINDILCFMNINNYKEINGYICTQDKRTINDVERKMNVVKSVKITNDNGKITLHYDDDEYYSDSNNIEDYYSIINKYIIE